ncbi:hypothetical protein [Oryzihumus leptocrescens]|nr:hypothetical protein [Oryzihumus leptocrescens]
MAVLVSLAGRTGRRPVLAPSGQGLRVPPWVAASGRGRPAGAP